MNNPTTSSSKSDEKRLPGKITILPFSKDTDWGIKADIRLLSETINQIIDFLTNNKNGGEDVK